MKIWKLDFADDDDSDWATCTINASKSMFGHTARIFQHKIIKYAEKLFIITVGEDSNVCIWTEDGRLVSREFIAVGVSLYNLDFDYQRQLLFTCGSDGNIHQLHMKNILEKRKFIQSQIVIGGLCQNEYPAKLVVMQQLSILIILTNQQNLFYKRLASMNDNWTPIEMPSNRYKITIIEAMDDFFAIGGYNYVTIFQYQRDCFNIVLNDKLSSGVIRAFKFIDKTEFAICDGRGNGSYFITNHSISTIEKEIRFELPACKEQWFTACGRYGNFFVVSDRNGHLLQYEINAECSDMYFKHTVRHVNGLLGCTKLQPVKGDLLRFETIGHDGTIKTIAIEETTKEMQIQWRKTIPMAWCGQIYVRDENRWLLAGFNDSHFIMWQNDGEFRFEFDCGGGHRYWDILIDDVELKAHLIFIRHKIAHQITFNLSDKRLEAFEIPKTNWHTRPCNVMRIVDLDDQSNLLISGGEDNYLKFSVFDAGKMIENTRFSIDFIGDMVTHISSIRAIRTIQVAHNKFLLVSAGGRAQICVTEIDINGTDRKSFKFHEKCDFMLRSTDSQRKRSGITKDISFDPETRFMDLITYRKVDEIRIVGACSDGFIRCFRYFDDEISLCKSLFYGRCILNTHHMLFGERNILLSMATDGLIQFWSLDDFDEDSKPLCTLKHHDSGINSFDALLQDDNLLYIATGGDDQAIVLSLLSIKPAEIGEISRNSSNFDVSVVKTKRFPYNHTAQVNGVKFCRTSMALYSISVDQTIMRVDLSDFSIKSSGYTCISDIKGLNILDKQSKIIAYGCGMQILDL